MQRIHQSTSSATASADSEWMTLHQSGYAHTRASASSIVDGSRVMKQIVEAVSASLSTIGLQRRAHVTGGLVDVLMSPTESRYVCRARDHERGRRRSTARE